MAEESIGSGIKYQEAGQMSLADGATDTVTLGQSVVIANCEVIGNQKLGVSTAASISHSCGIGAEVTAVDTITFTNTPGMAGESSSAHAVFNWVLKEKY